MKKKRLYYQDRNKQGQEPVAGQSIGPGHISRQCKRWKSRWVLEWWTSLWKKFLNYFISKHKNNLYDFQTEIRWQFTEIFGGFFLFSDEIQQFLESQNQLSHTLLNSMWIVNDFDGKNVLRLLNFFGGNKRPLFTFPSYSSTYSIVAFEEKFPWIKIFLQIF